MPGRQMPAQIHGHLPVLIDGLKNSGPSGQLPIVCASDGPEQFFFDILSFELIPHVLVHMQPLKTHGIENDENYQLNHN